MNNYEVIEETNEMTGTTVTIKRTNEDGSITFIPSNPANSDYQAYLASLDEQQAALATLETSKK